MQFLKNTIPAFFLLLAVLFSTQLYSQNAKNIELFGLVNRGDTRYSGSWSYVAADGSEYALVGAKTGTAAYPIDDPDKIVEVGFIPGPATNWREMTVVGDQAFVVTDVQGSGHSMQVIDLGYLPDSLHLLTTYSETFTTGHIIQKDIHSNDPYVYVPGTCGTCGVHILDVGNPSAPVEIGYYNPGYYIHDVHVRGNLMYAAAFYEYEMDIVDISDKTNPVLIGKVTDDGKNTHSSSLTEDGTHLIIADEADGYAAKVINLEEVDNPVEVAQYTANDSSLVHNPYVRGDFCYVSHNTEGLRVLDLVDPSVPVEVGYYDTYDGPSGGFFGLWSACPYFPSGKIIGGDREKGLYVWTFQETYAGRIYGVVVDSLTGEFLNDVSIQIPELSMELNVGLTGKFKTGMLEGSYTLNVESEGYLPKSIQVSLTQKDSLWLEIPLVPESYNATFESAVEVPALTVFPNPSNGIFTVKTDQFGEADLLSIFDQSGRFVFSQPLNELSATTIEIALSPGEYHLQVVGKEGELLGSGSLVIQ